MKKSSLLDRLTVASLGFLAISLAVIAGYTPEETLEEDKQPVVVPRNLCEEVAHEMNLFYLDGHITEAEARRIIDRCFAIFGPEK